MSGFGGGGLDVVALVAFVIALNLAKDIFAAVRLVDDRIIQSQHIDVGDGVLLTHADHFPELLVFDFLVTAAFLPALPQDVHQLGEQFLRN